MLGTKGVHTIKRVVQNHALSVILDLGGNCYAKWTASKGLAVTQDFTHSIHSSLNFMVKMPIQMVLPGS